MSNFFLFFIYHINKQIGIKIIKLKEYFGDTLIKWLVSICLQLKSELVPWHFLLLKLRNHIFYHIGLNFCYRPILTSIVSASFDGKEWCIPSAVMQVTNRSSLSST